MDMDNSLEMVGVGGRGWVEVEESIEGINGDGKRKENLKQTKYLSWQKSLPVSSNSLRSQLWAS